jgi:CBS domain containing-hemolysin-like protein
VSVQWIEGIILVLTIIFAGLAAAAETALTALSPAQVHNVAGQGAVGRAIAYLRDDPNRFLTTILIVNSTSLIVSSSVATILFGEMLPKPWNEIVVALGMSLIALIFSELTPKNIAVRKPLSVATVLARPVRWLSIVFRPFIAGLGALVGGLMALMGMGGGMHTVPQITEDEVMATLNLAEQSGTMTEEEAERIEGIVNLDKIQAGEVMRPRNRMITVPVDTSLMDALDVVLREGHSRIPVYEDTPDNIVGILYDKDLLRYIRENQTEVQLSDVVREAIFVPETKRADDLLRDFQRKKVHMAIVIDEYGGTAGLVTIEDLLEEIVGEIQDEYDTEEPLSTQISEDEWIFDAMLRIEEVNEEMDILLPAENGVETLGGFVFERLGEVAEVGDTVRADGVVLEVMEVDGRRIKTVRITRIPELDEEEDGI